MEKSYVSMQICPLCHKGFQILLDRQLKDSLPNKICNPIELCDKCKKEYLRNGVFLICPTSMECAVITLEAFSRIFNCAIPEHHIAYAEQSVIDALNKSYQESLNENQTKGQV